MNLRIKLKLSSFLIVLILTSNIFTKQLPEPENDKLEKRDKVNVLWIYLEDTAPLMSCYGEDLIQTPNIDQLAENGIKFTNAFMPAPVCSPCRSSLITGAMSTTFGLHNHHSSRTEESKICLPENVKTVPELFKENGYFTFNNGKDDYNFEYNREDLYSQDYFIHPIYGKSGERLPLGDLKEKQPFFGQIQLYGGKEIFSSQFEERVENPVDRDKIILPPYLPYHENIIEEYADHLDAIQITDNRIGEIISQLKADGLLENTVIFFFADHGMRLTRHKQFLYDGGIKVPFIVSWYKDNLPKEQGSICNDLISGLDISTTSLGLVGINIPEYHEGFDIFADNYKKREYVISTRDRCDFSIDRIRSVRTEDFKYIRNFMTDRPYLQTSYMDVDKVKFVLTMKKLYNENKLNPVQARFVSDIRPEHELYNLKDDPFEINNLANDPAYSMEMEKLSVILQAWIKKTGDKGQFPEDEKGLKFMYGIWGDYTVNPEYDSLKLKDKNYGGSLFKLKSEKWQRVSGGK